MSRQRMTGAERREQLIEVGRQVFAEKGFMGTTVEEIASRAGVTKPVVYEHFGGKEGLYKVIIDREIARLEGVVTEAISEGRWRERIEKGVVALLGYIETETDSFAILVRDRIPGEKRTYETLLNFAVGEVSKIFATAFEHRGFDPGSAVLYGQAMVGMVSSTASWWLDRRTPEKEVVAAHIVNLCWNGLSELENAPKLRQFEDEE